jgi:hypothetical protein
VGVRGWTGGLGGWGRAGVRGRLGCGWEGWAGEGDRFKGKRRLRGEKPGRGAVASLSRH